MIQGYPRDICIETKPVGESRCLKDCWGQQWQTVTRAQSVGQATCEAVAGIPNSWLGQAALAIRLHLSWILRKWCWHMYVYVRIYIYTYIYISYVSSMNGFPWRELHFNWTSPSISASIQEASQWHCKAGWYRHMPATLLQVATGCGTKTHLSRSVFSSGDLIEICQNLLRCCTP